MSLRILFILGVFFSGYISAQNKFSSENSDSSKSKINFYLFNKDISPIYNTPNFGNDFFIPDYSFFLTHEKQVPINIRMNVELSKAEFYNALGMVPQFRNKNDLGVLGDILVYTNTAATLYLLYKHIEKYGVK
ncbi:MAG: hypothetical protein SCALA702_35630 [Melioribacteraceae bacterium]|nr:MAG: hypothetical protein SCALA702_35630 [Melioribacteraceae bacterium]